MRRLAALSLEIRSLSIWFSRLSSSDFAIQPPFVGPQSEIRFVVAQCRLNGGADFESRRTPTLPIPAD